MISFACTHCGAKLRCEDGKAGRSLPCPKCRRLVQVPPTEQPHAGELVPVAALAPTPAYPAPTPPGLYQTVCRHCQSPVSIDPRWAGTALACPTCQAPLDVPGVAPPPPAAQPVTVNVYNAAAATSVAAPTQVVANEGPAASGCSCLTLGLLLGLLAIVGLTAVSVYSERRPPNPPPMLSFLGVWENPLSHDQLALSGDGTLEIRASANGRPVFLDGHWLLTPGQPRNLHFTVKERGTADDPVTIPHHAELGADGALLLSNDDGQTRRYVRVR